MNVNPEAFRTAAMTQGLAEADLDADPILQFQRWYQDAIAQDLPEPNAMSLATVDAAGQPSLRTVLLKLYDHQGFVFFTNYESRKSQEIGANPRVALLFPWVALARQVHIMGTARRISTVESLKYFATRPRGSQLGAWASPQSRVISSRSLLEQELAQIERRFGQGEVPLPHFWGGYRVEPAEIEFWQGRECRLHDRFRYRRSEAGSGDGTGTGGWIVERLAP